MVKAKSRTNRSGSTSFSTKGSIISGRDPRPIATDYVVASSQVFKGTVDVSKAITVYPERKRCEPMTQDNTQKRDVSRYLDNSHIVLNDGQWEEFQALLEQPARELANLQKLLSKPSVFE